MPRPISGYVLGVQNTAANFHLSCFFQNNSLYKQLETWQICTAGCFLPSLTKRKYFSRIIRSIHISRKIWYLWTTIWAICQHVKQFIYKSNTVNLIHQKIFLMENMTQSWNFIFVAIKLNRR